MWSTNDTKMAEKANVAVEQEKIVKELPKFTIGQGSIVGIDLKTYKNEKGQEYQVIIPEVAVVIDLKGNVKRYKGRWSLEFGKRIMKHLKKLELLHTDSVRFSDLIGRPTRTKVAERLFYDENGKEVYYKYADFITFLDNERKPIFIPKEEEVVVK